MKKATGGLIHPLALVESRLVGRNTRVWAFAHVMAKAQVGKECNVGEHVFIEDGAVVGNRVTLKNGVMIWRGIQLEDDVFVGPGVIFTNDELPRSPRSPWARKRYRGTSWCLRARVKNGASLGAGAIILPGVTIGRHAMVAAGAIVASNVRDHALVVGQPARQTGWVSPAGGKLFFNEHGAAICPITRTRWELESTGIRRKVGRLSQPL
jgi:acetyltransferase-like isoleucine patch superfamily enzyme